MSRGGPSTLKAKIYEESQFHGQGLSSPYTVVNVTASHLTNDSGVGAHVDVDIASLLLMATI